ncbi:SWIM zinc finger family protein [Halococcus sp. AFM35]|uniref:SWIM zinc finger family protein n=1 Tax=Halococcus sp. AFM35 TaxID=3421653 RepID=UPI003EB741DD
MSDGQGPTLTEAIVRELARAKSYNRGQSYYDQGAVSDVVQRGKTLRADVEGSQYQPYTVTIEFDDAGVTRTDCSCPYDHGGICKHRVAVLLTYIRDSSQVSKRQPFSELIADANPETLQNLLIELVNSRPEMADWVETRLTTADDETDTNSSVSVSLDSIRRQANHALPKPGQRGHNDAYAEAERMAEELDELIEQARMALDAKDGETALEVLAAITDELADNRWAGLLPHDIPSVYGVFGDLNQTFIEAVLTAELTERERDEWEDHLAEWDDQFIHFMGESTFMAAADAAVEGWDDERVQQAMAGNLSRGEFWKDEEPWYAEDIVTVRLTILEREDRIEEYLNLAEAAEQPQAYAKMLVQEERIEEAVDYAIERLSTPGRVLEVAKTLRAHEQTQAALQVGQHGLTLEGLRKDTLAEWLRDRAASAGDSDLALNAAVTAFEASPSLRAYKAVEEIADNDWESVQPDLLEFLRTQNPRGNTAARSVEVFLHEEQYDEAIELADSTRQTSVTEPVVEAVIEERPQWVISTCKSQAEPIIEAGQHDSYKMAVRWLRRAGEAAQADGDLGEWREYVETMRDDHYSKYKLRPMLDDLLEEF